MSLSEKITEVRLMNWKYVAVEDIKEFIRLLKEEINNHLRNETIGIRKYILKRIDKLAGDDLIELKGGGRQ